MKRLLILLIFCCCLIAYRSFAQPANDFPLKIEIAVDSEYVYPYKGSWFQKNYLERNLLLPNKRIYKLKVTISNTGNRSAFLYMMTCDKIKHLLLDNKLVDFLFWGCDSNFLTVSELKPGERNIFYTDVVKSSDYYTNTDVQAIPRTGPTRMGLKLIADIYERDFLWKGIAGWNDEPVRIIWSNALNL